ncbi:MAG: pyridoxal phosphate-dependent aminotransferase [Chitinophagales bacterium]|nr:pyridoxal phosphate-dependent aminotransferase [Chitinophagales bacterium]MCC7056378.1 pyridoxal phosphate-dependent aminotransferase [Chitinophagales bacterium]
MAAMARQLEAQGLKLIKLNLGEPDFNTPAHIAQAAKRGIDEGFTRYPPVAGYLDLREAICHKFYRDNNLTYKPNEIVVSTGAKQSIANAILSIINPGDEVILPKPYWVSYAAQVQLAEGVCVEIETLPQHGFKLTPQQLQNAITPRTKMLIFASPNNPTGAVYTQDELNELAKIIAQVPNMVVVSDEIYEHITYNTPHVSIASFDFIKDRVVTVNGLSKAYAMTGWRLGYMGATKEIAQACEKIQGQFTSGACSISQRAAIVALADFMQPTIDMRNEFAKRRNLILNLLNQIPNITTYPPEGAFYVFPDVSQYFGKAHGQYKINNIEDLETYLLYEGHLALVNGKAFGNDQCIRISYAASEAEIIEGMTRFKNALQKLT